jgi:hypothetical protein
MRLTKQLIFLLAFLCIAACAYGQDVHYNYDRSANFAAYRTYQWIEIRAVPDQLIDQAIKRAAEEQLAQKGLTRVENNADLYIGYQFVLNLEKSVSLTETGGAGPGWGWDPWGGGRNVQGQTSTVPVGILLIDLYDVGRKQLVWRGDAIKTINLQKDPDKNYKNLQKVMTKLFKNYPPQVSK